MSADLRASVDQRPMTRFQWSVIALCMVLNMIDGFDVLVMAFTASAVSAHWQLSGAQLGFLLSAGLFGMAGGSLLIAPWADRLGRKALRARQISARGGELEVEDRGGRVRLAGRAIVVIRGEMVF